MQGLPVQSGTTRQSLGSKRISRVNTRGTVVLTDSCYIIVHEVDDKQGARNADLAELENWFIAICTFLHHATHRSSLYSDRILVIFRVRSYKSLSLRWTRC